MSEIHRLLPQSADDEQATLGCILIHPQECMDYACGKGLTHDWFHIPANALIFRAIDRMWCAARPIDLITLTGEIRGSGLLEQVGGAAYVTTLFTLIPSAVNLARYIEAMDEKRQLRRIIKICSDYSARSYESSGDACALLDNLEKEVHEIRSKSGERDRAKTSKELVVRAVNSIQEIYERKGAISGLSTGLAQLDRATDGMHGQEFIIIAARPMHGKTALTMQMAEHMAVDLHKPVGIFSLEMSADQLMQRSLCARARVNMQRVRDGFMSERDFPAIQEAAGKLATALMYVEDGSDMDIRQLRSKARRMHSQHKIEALFIDSLSVLKSGHKDRHREVAEITNGLKELSKELKIPVVLIAHLSRGQDASRRPRLSDLRESGNIEQDADSIWFLVREELVAADEDSAREAGGDATLLVAKQRMGESGVTIPLTFLKEYTRFEARASDSYDESDELLPPAPSKYHKPKRLAKSQN